jgi:hypothetical protein
MENILFFFIIIIIGVTAYSIKQKIRDDEKNR